MFLLDHTRAVFYFMHFFTQSMLHLVVKLAISSLPRDDASFPQLAAQPLLQLVSVCLDSIFADTRLNLLTLLSLFSSVFFATGDFSSPAVVWHPTPPKPSTHLHFFVLLSQWPLMPQSTPHSECSQLAPK
jgi:hypothetical protein